MYEDLAHRILKLDRKIIDCNILSESDGAVLADVVRPEYQERIGGFSKTGSGMGPNWSMAMVSILKRLDDERSKLNYVHVARALFDAMFFLAYRKGKSLIIGILLDKGSEPAKIYGQVLKLIKS